MKSLLGIYLSSIQKEEILHFCYKRLVKNNKSKDIFSWWTAEETRKTIHWRGRHKALRDMISEFGH